MKKELAPFDFQIGTRLNKQSGKSRNCMGFTLIELLVVIVILALLSMIGLASFTNTQKRARDAKRKGDLKSIQNALEQYYQENSYNYPGGTYPNGISTYISGGRFPLIQKPAVTILPASTQPALILFVLP